VVVYFPLYVDMMQLVPIHQSQRAFTNDTLRYREAFIVKLYVMNHQIGEEGKKKQNKSWTVLFRLFARSVALHPMLYDEQVGSYPVRQLHPTLYDKRVGSYSMTHPELHSMFNVTQWCTPNEKNSPNVVPQTSRILPNYIIPPNDVH
jgi:hypothetical protein